MKKPIKFGKYLLLERINIGGMAEVFKAKSFGVEGFEKMLAIKRILPNIAEDEEFITMFIDEAKIAVQLNHANIAQIYDLGKIDISYFIALEFINGKDLRTIWDRHKKRGLLMPIPMSVYIMSRACEGLDYAHRKKDAGGRDLNIVHRDVSPQNVLISFEGEVKVIDFGIAKAANKASKTQAGILKGKFGYMSPEQVRGLPLDRRSDIFSAGIILYELLTGERLFVGESDFSTLEKVRNVEILPPSTYNRKIPDALEKIVLRALSKDPDDRYQSSYDMQEELQRFLILNKTNFARKDLANYMKRAFKADIERALARQAAFQKVRPEDAIEEGSASSQTAPGVPPGKPNRPAAPPTKPNQPGGRPAARPAPPGRPAPPSPPPPLAPQKPMPEVFMGDDDDEDDDIETVVFDPRAAAEPPQPQAPKAPGARPDQPGRSQVGSGPRQQPARRPAPPMVMLDSEPSEETITAPGGLARPSMTNTPTDDYELEPFSTGESTAAHDMPPPKKRSMLNLVIVILALVAVVIVGLAVFKFLQQKGFLGGGVSLQVQVTPPDATLFLDNGMVGDFSPHTIPDVSPGDHIIQAKRENYKDHQETIKIVSGEAAKVNIAMSFIPGALELTIEPADCSVEMDGELVGKKSPIRKDDILPGDAHKFTIASPGYQTETFEWKFEPKKTLTKKIILKDILFELDLESDPSGATIYLNDEKQGRTPMPIKGLKAAKQYRLRVTHPRYPDWESTIFYREGEAVQKVMARMSKATGAAPKPSDPGSKVAVKTDPKPKPKVKPKPTPKPRVRKPKGTGLLKLNSTPWGKVWIDGKDIKASTPLINYKLPAGKHKITIHFSTGEVKTVTVVIKANETVKKIVRK